MQLTPTEEAELEKANGFYATKGFEYFTPEILAEAMSAFGGMPNLAVLTGIAERLVEGLREECKKT